MKLYTIAQTEDAAHPSDFADGILLACDSLPSPAQTAERPGVGFLIAHHTSAIDYLILASWDRMNELPTRIFVREAGRSWRAARGSESFCVWDLQVIAHERDAYVRHMMREDGPRPADYLADSNIVPTESHSR
jgi:hypothetical protein